MPFDFDRFSPHYQPLARKRQRACAMALLGWERGFELWARKVLLLEGTLFKVSFSKGTHHAYLVERDSGPDGRTILGRPSSAIFFGENDP